MRRSKKAVRIACLVAFSFALIFSTSSLQAITAQLVATGLTQPLFVASTPADPTHIYIVQQTGQIFRLDLTNDTLDSTPFFSVAGQLTDTSGEQGLLGMAFDPNYDTNGKFYLNFVVPGGAFGNGTTHISQFQKPSASTPTPTPTPTPTKHKKKKKDKAKKKKHPTPTPTPSNGEVVLLTFDHPENNHNGGWIGFSGRANDDHNLYIATGDGGNSYDQGNGHIEPGGNAQNLTTLLGKMLRIHVDPTTGAVTIPADNPFVSSNTARHQIFLYGLRNPFRDSFDSATGRMFLGDVGQDTREEIDVQQATNPGGGENYGWRLLEGLIQTPGSVGGAEPAGAIDPILDYDHSVGQCIIGGYVYHGQVSQLVGKYVFGDYSAAKIITLDFDGTTASNFTDITSQLFPTRTGNVSLTNPSSFGVDASGEIYICDIGAGKVFKIIP